MTILDITMLATGFLAVVLMIELYQMVFGGSRRFKRFAEGVALLFVGIFLIQQNSLAITYEDLDGIYVKTSMRLKTTSTATSYTTLPTDLVVLVTSTAAARTITTTDADVAVCGRVLVVKDASNAAGTNNITIDPAGSTTIDGATTKVINSNSGVVRMVSDCTNWQSL